jgi:GTPase SAR1 family protein
MYFTRGLNPASVLNRSRQLAPGCVAWSPSGYLLVSSEGMVVNLCDARTGELLRPLVGHSDRVTGLAWSSDSKQLASCSADFTIRLWDIETGSFTTLNGHRGLVTGVAWSPDGSIVASCSNDRTIRLWDPERGAEVRVLEGHTNEVIILSFMGDSGLLASKATDQTLRLWRWQTGESVAILHESEGGSALALNPHSSVAASSNGSNIALWDIVIDLLASPIGETVRYTTAKIALVGDSGVGKTGMGWRLAHGTFKDHPSSHGQQSWVVRELAMTRADGTLCEAVLRDFAGQPDYRLTHAVFLGDVDLALVVFDPTGRQEPLKGVVYWLNQLAYSKRPPHTILVGARIDRGSLTMTQEDLEQFCHARGVTGGFVLTSASTRAGIPELLERIRDQIPWDEMIQTVTTATFKRLKEYVLRLKENVDQRDVLVTPSKLHEMVQAAQPQEQFSHEELITAVKHLEHHGYVTLLRTSSGEEIILLAPDLLIQLAASIPLEARRNTKGLGALDEARLLRCGYDFPETAHLHRQETKVLLDATTERFLERNLCFRERFADQLLLVFPSLINQKRPPREDIDTVEGFSYLVTGAVETVYPALVVLLGYTNTFTRTNQWQDQAEYEMGPGEVCGFRQINEREGQVELELYYGSECAPDTRVLFQALFERFLRHRDVAVTRVPPVNCRKCGYRQPREEVVKRLTSTKLFLHCGDCGTRIDLRDVVELKISRSEQERVEWERAVTDSRTSFETVLVRVKGIVRDRGGSHQSPSCFVSYARGDDRHERWVAGFALDLRNAGIGVVLDEWDNSAIGSSIPRFISRIASSAFVIVVGTVEYRRKWENADGSMVAAEFDLIQVRLTKKEADKETVLPVLLDGERETSFPPLLQGRLVCDMRREESYLESVLRLILTIYKIPSDHPAVSNFLIDPH